ncbi:DUF998 domain-containing protein [Actinoplanes sp. CA-252034]|uniref:DUF998 domain-containing protein n=1 Tax=Actinoplanes sp. CA-252034 TaxID=3239906 RepID=UPI003D998307
MRSSTPWWALLSSAAAPAVLIGGWTLAAQRQPEGYDSTVATISSLAAQGATDRWLMTVALLVVGACHGVTALGLSGASSAGRVVLGLGGLATMLVAVFPLPVTGAAPAHAGAAVVAFVALGVWPALACRWGGRGPVALRPVVSVAAAVVLLGLVVWFGGVLSIGGRVGLAERSAAGAQACWPLVVVLSTRWHARRGAATS